MGHRYTLQKEVCDMYRFDDPRGCWQQDSRSRMEISNDDTFVTRSRRRTGRRLPGGQCPRQVAASRRWLCQPTTVRHLAQPVQPPHMTRARASPISQGGGPPKAWRDQSHCWAMAARFCAKHPRGQPRRHAASVSWANDLRLTLLIPLP